MARKSILRKVGKAFVGLAAGGICLSPLQAQPPAARGESGGQAADNAGAPLAVDKEVTLAADGSFRATVLTRSGNLVPGARLTFTPPQPNGEGVVRATTGSAGLTVVSGVKPGLHRVHVEAPQGTYDGTLQVKSSAVVQAVALPAPLVAFVMTPVVNQNQNENQDQQPEDPGLLTPGDLARGRLLGAAALAGAATAIAVPLGLQGGKRPARRASP
ncbi:MAG TPA: carboxypeptidase-like regulatory domain-containing protein [Gemmataceae bacterium]